MVYGTGTGISGLVGPPAPHRTGTGFSGLVGPPAPHRTGAGLSAYHSPPTMVRPSPGPSTGRHGEDLGWDGFRGTAGPAPRVGFEHPGVAGPMVYGTGTGFSGLVGPPAPHRTGTGFGGLPPR